MPPVPCGTNADCDPFAQPFGSGINPDYNTECSLQPWAQQAASLFTGDPPDPATGLCFFKEPFPSTGGFSQ